MSEIIRTFLVDDEPLARQRMQHLLSSYTDLEIVGEFGNGTDCIDATLQNPPDLIFLDIGLPDHTGLEVVSELVGEMQQLPLIVFATAYNEHAISAFELNALDYLLKPVSPDRIALTVDRVRNSLAARRRNEEDKKLRDWVESGTGDKSGFPSQIEICDGSETHFVPVDSIFLFQADRNYLEVHTAGKVYLWRMTMARLEGLLDPEFFLRVSRSAIVAIQQVSSLEKKGRNNWANTESGNQIAVTRNLETLLEKMRSRS